MIDITKFDGHTQGPWTARCRHKDYIGGDWPRTEFLQWMVEGPETPDGRGDYYQRDAVLIAAAPDMLAEVIRLRESLGAVSNALAARLGTHADEWALVEEARLLIGGDA